MKLPGFYFRSPSLWVILLLAILLGTLKFTYLQDNILSYDYFGLYLYLPANFIYSDPGIADLSWLEQINNQYGNTPMFYQLEPHEGYNIIRFFSGMAILLSPFFFIGHAAAQLSAYPADGFSLPYQIAMTFAAWFYVVLGLVFLRKVLLRFVNEQITSITLIALYLGTNLFFWSTFDAGAPHTILFALYAILIWYTIRWHEKPRPLFAVIIGLVLGLIIISRPSDIIAIIIPLLWNIHDSESLRNKLRLIANNFPHIFLLILFAFLAGLPQILYFKTFTGQLFFSPYNDPQSVMDWANPRFSWVLFSFRKGWFIYAPLMIFAVAGLGILIKKNKPIALAIIVYFLLNLYLISAFTSLVSYGWRAFIQSYAVLAIPLAYTVAYFYSKTVLRKIVGPVLLAGFVMLSVFQSWQVMTGIIHGSRMTKDYYLGMFGKTSVTDKYKKLLRIDHYMDEPDFRLTDTTSYSSYELAFIDFSEPYLHFGKFQVPHPDDSSKLVFMLNSEMQFTPGVKVPYLEITDKEHFWARMRFSVMALNDAGPNDLKLVATFAYRGNKKHLKGKPYKYRGLVIQPTGLEAGRWYQYQIDYLSPEPATLNDRFETYLWAQGGNSFLVDQFEVRIFEPLE
jgi:hypothetical protein